MKSPELSEFFSLLGKAKKEKEEEFDNLLKEANINLDVLVKTVSSGIKKAKVEVKEQKKKGEKFIEQLDVVLEDVAKPPKTPEVVIGVPEDFNIESLEEENEEPVVEEIQEEEKEEDAITKAIKFIEDTTVKEEVENSDVDVQSEIRKLKNILNRVLAQGPGSGEVNLLKLDDVDEDSAKVDGKFLKYQSSTGKFVGADASGGGGGGIGANDSVNTTGIITAAQFSGFSHLIAPYATTKTITVKVASKVDGEHRYYGTGSGQGYVLDNVQSPFLTLTPGRTYRFDVSDSSNSGHPFRFYLDAAKATAYTTGVTVGSGYVDLEVTDSTPTVLHYQCSSHGYMGNSIQVSSSNAIKLNSQAASYYLDYDNFTNTPTIPTNNNQLTNGAGYTTFDGAYSSLSGRPTIPTNNNQLTNGAGYITTSFTSYNQLSDTPTIPTNNNQLTNGAGYITTSFTNTNQLTNGANFITASDNITGTSAGLTGTPSITVTNITASGNVSIAGTLTYEDVTNVDSVGLVTARSGLVVGTGVTLSKDGDGFFTGVTTATTFVGSLTGTASNATQLNSQAASYYLDYNNFSNTPTIPTNNNQLTNGAGFITGSALNASNLNSGTIPDARFPSTLPAIDGSALTGIAVTDNIRTNTNATFLQNVNVSGTTTATTFIGNLTGNVTGNVSGTSGSTTGNAATATKLATARTIAGVSFDGSSDISLNNNAITNGAGFITSSGTAASAQGLTGSPNITVTNVNAVDAIISGNLSVAGTITSLDQNDILATGIITASSGVDLGDPGIVTLSSDTLTTTSTSADTVASVSATVNRSATFQVQVTRGTQYHMTTINVIHDGTNAFMSEYGTVRTGEILATFDADISGGNLRLRVTPTSTASTVFKLSKTTIKV